MADLVSRFLSGRRELMVLEIGSLDINGSYRALLAQPDWKYIGVDLGHGAGVDVVLRSAYRLPFKRASIDVVISGQAFEHAEFFWLTWLEMVRVLRAGGLIFLIAPSRGEEHRYPVDCWRFYPDGYRALAKYAGVELLEVSTDWLPHPAADSAQWGDTVGVFRRPASSPRKAVIQSARQWLSRRLWSW